MLGASPARGVDTPRRSRLGRWAGNLFLAVIAPVVVLTGLEAAARLTIAPGPDFALLRRNNCLQHSALLGDEFRPHCHTVIANTDVQTNNLGLRDRDLEDDGATRILALGDSCTWGWGVEQDATYPAVLERLLNARGGGRRYRVVNAGTPGLTSYHGLVYLRERGLALHPSIVIIGYYFNDAFLDGDVEDRLTAQRRVLPLLRLSEYLSNHSRLWTTVQNLTRRPPTPDKTPRVIPEKFERNLRQMITLARQNGVAPVILNLVGVPASPYYVIMDSIAREFGVPTVVYQGPRLDIVHPTRDGDDILAHALLTRMDAAGYLE